MRKKKEEKEDYLVINPQGLGSSGLGDLCTFNTATFCTHSVNVRKWLESAALPISGGWLSFSNAGSNVPVSHPDLARFLSKDIPS